MLPNTAKDIWDYLKMEYVGYEWICAMHALNLIGGF